MRQILFALVFIGNIFSASAQSNALMKVEYEMKQVPDSTNINNFSVLPYTLVCNTERSIYFNRESKIFYNTINGNTGGKLSINNMSGMPKFPRVRGSFYKNGSMMVAILPIAKDMYQFKEPVLKWEILRETKQVKGYKCQLAKTVTDTGQTFYAWFTKDIPIQDGPFRFKGLSGLILEVYNKNKTIEIYATEISKCDEVIEPIKYGRIIEVSKDQYLKTRTIYQENPSGYNNNEIIVTDMNGNNLNKNIDSNIRKINVFLD